MSLFGGLTMTGRKLQGAGQRVSVMRSINQSINQSIITEEKKERNAYATLGIKMKIAAKISEQLRRCMHPDPSSSPHMQIKCETFLCC